MIRSGLSEGVFFGCAIGGGWKESGDQRVKLPEADVNVDAFTTYVNWLLLRRLDDLCYEPDHSQHNLNPEKCDCFVPASHAYLLGDFLQDNHFCNSVIDHFASTIVETSGFPTSTDIRHLWDLIHEYSGFRRLLIDQRAYYWNADSFEKAGATLSHYYFLEVVGVWHALYNRNIKAIHPEYRERRYYHEGKNNPDLLQAQRDVTKNPEWEQKYKQWKNATRPLDNILVSVHGLCDYKCLFILYEDSRIA